MASGKEELAHWNPMEDDYRDDKFNSYDRGPGRNLPRNSQKKTSGVKLYVTRIPVGMTSEGLGNLFGRCGKVTSAVVCPSKFNTENNTTYGFVEMETTAGGTEALRLLNGFWIGDHVQLSVKIAKTEEEKQKEKEEREANEQFLNSLPGAGRQKPGSYWGNSDAASNQEDNFIISRSGEKILFAKRTDLANGIQSSPGDLRSQISPSGASVSSKTPMKLNERFENLKITPSDRGRHIDVLEDNIPLVLHTNDDENGLDKYEAGSDYSGGYRRYYPQGRNYMPFQHHGRGGYGRWRGQTFGYVNHMNKPGLERGFYGYGNYPQAGGRFYRPMGRGGNPYHQQQYRPPYYQQQVRPMGRGMGNFQQQHYGPQPQGQQFQHAPYGNQGARPKTNSINYKPEPQKPCKVEVRPCNVCQRDGTFQCGKCRTPYCCRDCQAKDWPTHQKACSQIRSQREHEDSIENQFEISVGDDIVEKMVKTVEQYTGNKVEVSKKVPQQQDRPSKESSKAPQQKSPRAITNQKSPRITSQKSPKPNQQSAHTRQVPQKKSPVGGTSQISPVGAPAGQKTPQKSHKVVAEQKPSIPPTMLPIGNEVDVIVLDVFSPGSIIIQLFDHEMIQATVEQENKMAEIYSRDQTQVTCPAVGDFLVGHYMDSWYRLQVNQVISPDKFKITYIDYGNRETITLAEMRYLKPDMFKIPAQAIECCLEGIGHANDSTSWSSASVDRVKELVPPTLTAGVLYKAKAVKLDGNVTHVRLLDGNGADIGDKLLSEGHVTRSLYQTSKVSPKANQPSDNTRQVLSQKSPAGSTSQISPLGATARHTTPQKSPRVVAEQKSSIPPTRLPMESEVDVIVLAVSSPGSITVQQFDRDMVQAAVQQETKMAEIYSQVQTQVTCPAVGDFLVGHYMDSWYRLQVNQVISPDKFQVTYIDYGNQETVTLAEMRYLKPDMFKIPAQAIECCLEGIGHANDSTSWSPASVDRVKELVPPTLTAGVLYKAKAVKLDGNVTHIKLMDGNGADIGDKLLSEGLVSVVTKKSEIFMAKALGNIADLMPEGSTFDLFVIDKQLPNRLVCQVLHKDFVDMFTQFQEAFLELMESDTSAEYRPQCIGELVVGKFSGDQMWYRAEVLALTNKNATLCYVDFGNKEKVPFTSIRQAVDLCTKLPIQSFVCVPINKCSLEQAVKISAVIKKKENSEMQIEIEDAAGLPGMMEKTEETIPKVEEAKPKRIMYPDIKKIQLPVDGSKVAMTFSDASSLYSFHLRKSDTESQAQLDKVMKDVHEYCSKNVVPYEPEVNEMVCVQFSADGVWYRARVTNIEGDVYSVQYIDHGNSENVGVNAIRKIDPSLLVTPLQSVHCRVAGMMPELQTNDMVGVFATAMQSPVIYIQAKHVGADVTDVVIFLTDGTNLNEIMLGADANTEMKESPEKSSKAPGVSPKQSVPPPVQEVSKPLTVPQLQVPLDGSRIKVTVTDLLSLCLFAAQSLDNMQEFTQMSSHMGEFCESIKEKHTPTIGEIVFAKFSADNQWYRARVVECIASENYHLTFIDYGNSDIVQSACIRKMTADFTALPAQSFQCKLSGVMEECQPEDALMIFAGKVLNNQIELQAIKRKDDVYEVELFTNDGVSINNMFKTIDAPAAASAPSPVMNSPVGKVGKKLTDIDKIEPKGECSLLITHVNNPKDFFCQIANQDNIQLLGVLMNSLALECAVDTPHTNFKPEEGDLCCAKYEVDDGWYRSVIQAVQDEGRYRVLYLDFGNEGIVSSTDVHPPSEEFFKLPVMAFQCSLVGIKPSGPSWTQASVAKMNEYQLRELSTFIKSKENNVLQVQMSWEGTDLVDDLLQAGLASKAAVGPSGDATTMSEEEKEAIQRQIAQLQAMIGQK